MSQDTKLIDKPLVIEPQSLPADAVVIWLHGLGADGHDFESILPELALPESHPIRFIFPHAPVQAVTINGGVKMRSWYDIRSLDFLQDVDAAGIAQASQNVTHLIAQQVAQGIAPEKIVLAGFSQGGLVALHCGLQWPQKLAGILALSTYYPADELLDKKLEMIFEVPVLMMHGEQDPVIPLSVAQASRTLLQSKGVSVAWQTFAMQHQLVLAQIKQIGDWLQQRLI